MCPANGYRTYKVPAGASNHREDVHTVVPEELQRIKARSASKEANMNLDIHNYKESKHVPMDSRKDAIYIIKQVGWNSSEHTFVLHSAKEETQRYTSEVIVDETSRTNTLNPDLRFKKTNGEEWAIEVETGSNLKHNPTYLDEKVTKLNTLYPNKWRWLLTNSHKRKQYETKYSTPVLLRHNYPHWIKYHFRQQDNRALLGSHENIDDKNKSEQPTKKQNSLTQQTKKQAVPTEQAQNTNKMEMI